MFFIHYIRFCPVTVDNRAWVGRFYVIVLLFASSPASLQIRMRDDGLPLAHVAIAVEGASASSPDIVPLMVANSIIGSFDLTYGGGKVGEIYMSTGVI